MQVLWPRNSTLDIPIGKLLQMCTVQSILSNIAYSIKKNRKQLKCLLTLEWINYDIFIK